MRRIALMVLCYAALAACVTTKIAPPATKWDARELELQRADAWQLQGRAAVALGTQGWQASINWRQADNYADVHLSGPFGIGAVSLRQEPEGLSVNGAPPSEAMLTQMQERLGFELPLQTMRFWLLGIPDPATTFDLVRNAQDRAQQLTQDGWTIVYDRYAPVGGDLLPAHLVLSRADVRVRIAIDQWTWPQ
jgi:outer membrane lipoprotein LolB